MHNLPVHNFPKDNSSVITETRYTLEARLSADAALDALLDRDPNVPQNPRPAILYGHNSAAAPAITCVTFRITTLTPEAKFRPALPATSAYAPDGTSPPAVDATSPITNLRVDLEAWTLKRSAAVGEAIMARLMALLDNQAWPVLDADQNQVGRVFKGSCLTAQLADYDPKLNSQFGLFSFNLRVVRTGS